jgi:hypothetical protein
MYEDLDGYMRDIKSWFSYILNSVAVAHKKGCDRIKMLYIMYGVIHVGWAARNGMLSKFGMDDDWKEPESFSHPSSVEGCDVCGYGEYKDRMSEDDIRIAFDDWLKDVKHLVYARLFFLQALSKVQERMKLYYSIDSAVLVKWLPFPKWIKMVEEFYFKSMEVIRDIFLKVEIARGELAKLKKSVCRSKDALHYFYADRIPHYEKPNMMKKPQCNKPRPMCGKRTKDETDRPETDRPMRGKHTKNKTD